MGGGVNWGSSEPVLTAQAIDTGEFLEVVGSDGDLGLRLFPSGHDRRNDQ